MSSAAPAGAELAKPATSRPPGPGTVTPPEAWGGVLRRVFDAAFNPVDVPPEALERLRTLAERGVIVHVQRSAAVVSFLFLQHRLVTAALPVVAAVGGLGFRVWRIWARIWAGKKVVRAPLRDDVVAAAKVGKPSLVFLRRPGSIVAQAVQRMTDPFPGLVRLQRTLEKPIYLVPELLIWERRPRSVSRSLFDVVFGEIEAPGFWRSLLSFLWNRKRAFVRLGEPVDLKAFLSMSEGQSDEVIARKVRGALSQHLARQTRVVTGPPLKWPSRVADETLRDRALRATLAEVSRERGRADSSVEKEAGKCLREISATYSPRTIDFMAWGLDLLFNRIYDGIEVDETAARSLAEASARMPLVICPSHKSHIDYLVMSTVFYERGMTPPHIAAGINLSFWPIGVLFRNSGAFFIRRSFKGDRVYGAVLKAYVRKLLKDGFTQEFFLEGGRSRTGKLLLPRFGMLSMEVEAWIDGARPDVAFCPSWIGYAQIIEGKTYARELAGAEKKSEDLGALLRAPAVLTSRYGRVYIRFDKPVSLAELAYEKGFDREKHTDDQKRELVRALGFRIANGINRATALTPSGLLATALLAHDRRGLDAKELADRLAFLVARVADVGGSTTFSVDAASIDPLGKGPIHEARLAFEKSGAIIVHSDGGTPVFATVDEERVSLDYHKNSALHFFSADALLATAVLTAKSVSRGALQERTLELSRLLKLEFIYAPGAFEKLFADRLARFVADGFVRDTADGFVPAAEGAPQMKLRLLADLLVNFVESYLAAAQTLPLLLEKPLDMRELVGQTLDRARGAYRAGKLRKYETLSKVTFENAFARLEQQGVLVRGGEKGRKLSLAPAFASVAAIDKIQAEIQSFLVAKAD